MENRGARLLEEHGNVKNKDKQESPMGILTGRSDPPHP